MAAGGDETGAELIRALEWIGLHAKPVLLASLFVIPLLPLPHGAFLPLLPVIIALLIGLPLSRLDLASILSDLADPRFLPALLAGICLFQIAATVGLTGLGGLVGLGSATLLMIACFMASPVLSAAPGIALLMGYDARLTLYWMLASSLLSPLMIPLALGLSGVALPIEPARIAMNVAAVLAAGVFIGVGLRRVIGPVRIAAEGKAMDGAGALVMIAFLLPISDGVAEEIWADPGLALRLAGLALMLNLGGNLLVRSVALRFFAPGRAKALGLAFGNRNIGLLLAALPPDPVFSLFVALAQIPIYASPLILRFLDREEEAI